MTVILSDSSIGRASVLYAGGSGFKSHQAECDYLKDLLKFFTTYMDENKLNKNEEFMLFMGNPCIGTTADSIEKLYTDFRIFVEGYCRIYEGK